MYRLINANAGAVVQALGRIGDLREYTALRSALVADPGVTSSATFQRSYRRYWRMNAARLSPAFYSTYFDLLAVYQGRGEADVRDIAIRISDREGANHGLQFSFATKLAHMSDPRTPVFDSFVAGFYFFTPPPSERPFEERLDALLSFHRFLQREYSRVLSQGLLAVAIARLRADERLDDSTPDERLVDWLVWAWVSLLRRGAQSRGEALYE